MVREGGFEHHRMPVWSGLREWAEHGGEGWRGPASAESVPSGYESGVRVARPMGSKRIESLRAVGGRAGFPPMILGGKSWAKSRYQQMVGNR